MTVLRKHLSVLSFFLLTLDVQAGLYYDQKSCQKYEDVLNKGFDSAFDLVDKALVAIGGPANGGTAQWSFHDSESKDLAARIFGDATNNNRNPKSIPVRYAAVKANYEYVRDNFRPTNQPNGKGILIQDGVDDLTETDILVYCDLDRLKKEGSQWVNKGREDEGNYPDDDYKSCKSGDTLGITRPLEGIRQVMQLCRMDKIQKKKFNVLPDRKNTWMKNRGSFRDLCRLLRNNKKWEADYYDMFDHTLVHELTHCIKSEKKNDEYVRVRTSDIDPNGGYHWDNVYNLRTTNGFLNADSHAFFAMGAWMLNDKQTKISNSGCLAEIPNYTFGGQAEDVDNTWAGPAQKRDLDEFMNWNDEAGVSKRIDFNPLEMRQFITSYSTMSSSSLIDAGTSNTTFTMSSTTSDSILAQSSGSTASSATDSQSTTTLPTGLDSSTVLSPESSSTVSSASDSATSISGTPSSASDLTFSSSVTTSLVSDSGSTNTGTASLASDSISTNTETISLTSDSTLSNLGSSSTGGSSSDTLSEATTTGSSSDGASVSSTFLETTTGIDSTGASASNTPSEVSTGSNSTEVLASSTSSQASTDSSATGVPESSTSSQATTESSAISVSESSTLSQAPTGSSSTDGATDSLSSSSSAQSDSPSPTPGPTITTNAPGLPISFFSETPTASPDGTFLLCPAITSCLKPTPTWLESIISPTDLFIPKITDLGAVPTKKVKQHEDDDDDKAVIFAKIELPKDKCNPLPKPKAGGLLGVVANVANKVVDTVMDAACNMEFPTIDGNLPDWLDLTKFPGLKDYPPPSGKPTEPEEPSKSNKESSASSSSSSCSATAIPQCKGTNIVSGTVTKGFTTDCSTITACSGTGVTSITDITAMPSYTEYVHPLDPPGWDDQQDCFQGLMENADGDHDAEALGSCLGVSMTPLGPEESSSSGSSESPGSTDAATTTDASSSDSGSATPSATPSQGMWLCTDSEGDRGDIQCNCSPIGCTGDKCTDIVMQKGQDGCNDKCEGCNPPAPSAAPTPTEAPQSSTPAPVSTPASEWKCTDPYGEYMWNCQHVNCPQEDIDDMKTKCSCTKTDSNCTENCTKDLRKNQDGCNDDCDGCKP